MGCGSSKEKNQLLVNNFFGEEYTSPRNEESNVNSANNINDDVDVDVDRDEDDSYEDYEDDIKFGDTTASTSDRKSERSGRSGNKSERSGRSIKSGSDLTGRSNRSGRTTRSGLSTRSGFSARSRRSYSSGNGKTPPGYVTGVTMAGTSLSGGSTSSSRKTELRRNHERPPRSPPPPYMNIYIQEPRKEPSFKVPISSEVLAANTLPNNILDEPIPKVSSPPATPAAPKSPAMNGLTEGEKKPSKAPSTASGADATGSKQKKEPTVAPKNKSAAASPAMHSRKASSAASEKSLASPTAVATAAAIPTEPEAAPAQAKVQSNVRKSASKRQSGNAKPTSAVEPVPPPPPFTSLVREKNDNDKFSDILISPLTAPTMVVKIPGIPREIPREFSVAPSLKNQKRSIMTVSKRIDAKISNGDTINDKAAVGAGGEKRITTDIAFDDIYERGKQLGYGAFASVFLATHKPSGAKYAVKEVDRSSMVWNNKDHLKHEIDNMFKVREGPNIVQLYEVYSNDGDENEKKKSLCHLVVELMEGGELFDRIIEKRTFTEREARDSIRCVLEALEYMHDRRVVHRDLKPENLLLKLKDKSKLTPVKLADFGFAKCVKNKNGCRSLCGTPGYLAPEILERFPSYDVQCDVWSVGAILFLLLGGYLPFDDDNEEKVFDRTRNATYDFNPRCWRKISFGAKDLISKCLTIDPRKRYTAKHCLNHSWMAKSEVARDAKLDTGDLAAARDKGKRKMRAAVHTVSIFVSAFQRPSRLGGAYWLLVTISIQ
jgi:calcium/calmodulin-dependent protein kinase I